jgi:two-component system sensor histidine kinase/response regulator
VVDDNATNRRILRDMLTRWRMKPTEVDGGVAALAALQTAVDAKAPFSLILLDVVMPGMDGFTVLEHIRRRPEASRPTILMLTSADHREDVARCRELGAAAYLIKPIQASELRDAIGIALRISIERNGRQAATPAKPVEPAGRGLRILVAEDNAVNQLFTVRALEKAGHRVAVANNGKEVLATLEREAFDLVVMDVQMPVMDGFEATALIREKEKGTGEHIPIVALTAHAMKGDRERCLEAGMDGYLPKPVQKKGLLSAIAAAAAGTAQPTREGAGERDAEEAGDGSWAMDPLEEDEAFRRELAGMFLEDCPKLLSEIREAVARRDGPALKLAAHTLKGSIGVFKDPDAFEAAFRMERVGRDIDWDRAEEASAVLTGEMARLTAVLADLTAPDTFPLDNELPNESA